MTILLGPASCAPAASTGGFNSPNPSAQIYAIEDAVHDRDLSRVPDIVELLDSDDPAVRLVAIEALCELTGTRLSYEHDAPRREREAAIHRWQTAVETGSVATPPARPPGSASNE